MNTSIRDLVPDQCVQLETAHHTDSRSYEFRATPGNLLVRPLSLNVLSFPALDRWSKAEWPRFMIEVPSYLKITDGKGKILWDGAEMVVERSLLENHGWESFENVPRGQFHTQRLLTILYQRQLWILRPGVYPIDFPMKPSLVANAVFRPVKNLSNVPLAIKEGMSGNNDRWAHKFGYAEFYSYQSIYLYEESAEGVKALIALRGAKLMETNDPAVMTLLVRSDPRHIGAWIGPGGSNAKKFCTLLGLRYLKVEGGN